MGLSTMGLINLAKKHKAEADKNNKATARHNRESRITDMLDKS